MTLWTDYDSSWTSCSLRAQPEHGLLPFLLAVWMLLPLALGVVRDPNLNYQVPRVTEAPWVKKPPLRSHIPHVPGEVFPWSQGQPWGWAAALGSE